MLFTREDDRFLLTPGAFHILQIPILIVKMMPEHLQHNLSIRRFTAGYEFQFCSQLIGSETPNPLFAQQNSPLRSTFFVAVTFALMSSCRLHPDMQQRKKVHTIAVITNTDTTVCRVSNVLQINPDMCSISVVAIFDQFNDGHDFITDQFISKQSDQPGVRAKRNKPALLESDGILHR